MSRERKMELLEKTRKLNADKFQRAISGVLLQQNPDSVSTMINDDVIIDI